MHARTHRLRVHFETWIADDDGSGAPWHRLGKQRVETYRSESICFGRGVGIPGRAPEPTLLVMGGWLFDPRTIRLLLDVGRDVRCKFAARAIIREPTIELRGVVTRYILATDHLETTVTFTSDHAARRLEEFYFEHHGTVSTSKFTLL